MEDMINNFVALITTYGHIPNGNRSYYLSRSQPPFFAMMLQLLERKKVRWCMHCIKMPCKKNMPIGWIKQAKQST